MLNRPIPAAPRVDRQGPAQRPHLPKFLLACSSLAAYHGAMAQDAADTGTPHNKSSAMVEEIIVTATRRAQSIQNVPLSIAAIGSEEIDRRGLVSAEDYLRGIPGVNQMTESIGAAVVIRGIETSPASQNFSSGTTVATYFGETPTTNSAGLGGGANVDIKLVDIERVEVLRGPQGTSFGNSSLGGAVRTIPAAPRLDRLEGKVSANYSVTSGTGGDNHMVQGVANLPLIDNTLAIRATAYRFEESGFYRNVGGSDSVLQSYIATLGPPAAATNDDEVGAQSFVGGRIAALFQPSSDLKLTVSYLTQKTEVDGQAFTGMPSYAPSQTGAYEQSMPQVAPEHVVRGQKGGVFDTDIDILNATLEYDFGWAQLLTTFSNLTSGSTYSLPARNLAWSQLGFSDHDENSGEIRLTSQLEGDWNFIVGLYAEDLKDDARFNYTWLGSSGSPFGANRRLGDYHDHRNLKQKAAFAEVSWEFIPRFTLTGGVRAYDYERVNQLDTTGALFSTSTTKSSADASGTSFRGNLSYQINEDALVYAGWSQGFRLGKPQPGLPSGVCDLDNDGLVDGTNTTIDQTKRLESDEVDSFEIGTKLTLLERRLTLAMDVYRIDWSGVPFVVRAPTPPSGCGFTYNANAGAAVSQGVEFQANYYITDALRIDVGSALIDASLTRDAPAVNAFDGDRLPGSPKVNANLGLQYGFELAGHDAFVRADSIYVGEFYGNLQGDPRTEAGGYLKVDASLRVVMSNLSVDLFVRNLTNADDFSFRGVSNGSDYFGYRLRPRTIGIQLGYDF